MGRPIGSLNRQTCAVHFRSSPTSGHFQTSQRCQFRTHAPILSITLSARQTRQGLERPLALFGARFLLNGDDHPVVSREPASHSSRPVLGAGVWSKSCASATIRRPIAAVSRPISTTRSARGCHPCLGCNLLPMSPDWTRSRSGGEGVSQLPLKDKAFSIFPDQNPPFELRPKKDFGLRQKAFFRMTGHRQQYSPTD
jgi:hypothetical protein